LKLSVIIPCYNAAHTIADQLNALVSQQCPEPWEILVVNNRSTDSTVEVVEGYRQRLPNLRIIEAAERQGQSYALNIGVRAASGEHLLFCDADDVVGEGWVAAMGEALLKYDFVSGPFEIEKLNQSSLQMNRVNPQPDGIQEYTNPPYLPHTGGGNMGVKRSVFEAVGGFDESMAGLFDTDFCWRVQLAGTELHAVPNAILHVRYRDTPYSIFKQAKLYGEYNVFLYKRYRPQGMPELSWRKGVRAWIDLFLSLPNLRDKEERPWMLWALGWRLGRLYGCLKYRVLAL
jgi:glycosyltransferase involved in cell wall biosynthesis